MPSTRQLRVAEQIKQFMNEAFIKGSFNDKDLKKAIISINEVKISPDLKNATAYVSVIGEQYPHHTIKALNKAVSYFKKGIATNLNLKYTPQIKFVLDNTLELANSIEEILKEVIIKEE